MKEDKKKPKCKRCDDTGLYDACCRPHQCSCEAGKAYDTRPNESMELAYSNLNRIGNTKIRY